MFEKLKKYLNKNKVIEVPLEFTLDLNKDNKHIIQLYVNIDGQKIKVPNINKIWDYGSTFKINDITYTLSKDSIETILSIRSVNPQIDGEGRIVSDVCPPVLQYLRKKPQVKESPRSEELKTSDKPLKPTAKINYDPGKRINVETGLSTGPTQKLLSPHQLLPTSEKGWVRHEKTFYQLPSAEDPTVKKWLSTKYTTVPLNGIPEFFLRDLVLLKTKFEAVLNEDAKMIDIVKEPFRPEVYIDANEKGWLDFKVTYQIGKYKIPHGLFKNKEDKFVQFNKYVWVKHDKKMIQKTDKQLQELGITKIPQGYRLDVAQFASLEEFIKSIGGRKQTTTDYRQFLNELTGFSANENFKLPPDIENQYISEGIQLRPYQRSGIHWLTWLKKYHLHGILADDMGLGKTIQTIANIQLAYRTEKIRKHSLIICPKSVIRHWTNEIARCYPKADTYEFIGTNRNRRYFKSQDPIIFISTYATVVNDIDLISNVPLYFVVLDESTNIKNPAAKRTQAIKKINSAYRIALSGTPIENRPAEIWSVFDFLMKGHLGKQRKFIDYYEKPISKGDKERTNQLSTKISPFLLRRLKENVATDLPDKIPMNEWVELTEEQKALYGQIQDKYVNNVRDDLEQGRSVNYTKSILPAITKLKQVCDHPALITKIMEPIMGRSNKFDLVIEKISKICEKDEQVVLFSHFLGTLDLFESVFNNNGVNYIRIDGSTRNRQDLIDRFNRTHIDTALCSIKACGHGINLTAANHVIHVDRWWNPAVEDQATDRVHRIGQDKIVYVYKISTQGTLEEKIAKILERKRKISDDIIGPATSRGLDWS
ncbi:MAG: DEAD/DEAH box helicase, partial [Thermoplasmata archaeon]|nr:DEAD/DEAH box helicase [Thermoplasmata archaeon]